jgi:hypothetical protein
MTYSLQITGINILNFLKDILEIKISETNIKRR